MKKIIVIIIAVVILAPVVYFGLLFLGMGGLSSIIYNAKYSVVFISKNPNLCEKLYSEDEDAAETWPSRYSCYKDFAISNNDESICEKIPKRKELIKIINSCYHNIAIKKNDTALCAKIEDLPIYNNSPIYNHCLEVIKENTSL